MRATLSPRLQDALVWGLKPYSATGFCTEASFGVLCPSLDGQRPGLTGRGPDKRRVATDG
jgi:hypothetical protein